MIATIDGKFVIPGDEFHLSQLQGDNYDPSKRRRAQFLVKGPTGARLVGFFIAIRAYRDVPALIQHNVRVLRQWRGHFGCTILLTERIIKTGPDDIYSRRSVAEEGDIQEFVAGVGLIPACSRCKKEATICIRCPCTPHELDDARAAIALLRAQLAGGAVADASAIGSFTATVNRPTNGSRP